MGNNVLAIECSLQENSKHIQTGARTDFKAFASDDVVT